MKSIEQSSSSRANAQHDAPFFQGASGASFFSPATTQPKLTIGAPDDQYEKEADAMGERVVQMSSMFSSGAAAPGIQRQCSACAAEEQLQTKPDLQKMGEEEKEEEMVQTKPDIQLKCAACQDEEEEVQMKSSGGESTASPDLASKLSAKSGSGQPLTADTQTLMGHAIGADFSAVRVHTDSDAIQMNRELSAHAFTHGRDVYFNAGKYEPGTTEGKRLLGHELGHVVQQGGGIQCSIQRDLAIESAVPTDVARNLSRREIIGALAHNRTMHPDNVLIAELRDVLGLSRTPATIDEDFVHAVARFQALHGITQDGRIGQITAIYLSEEFEEEGNILTSAQLLSAHGSSIDINTSFCGCQTELNDTIQENLEFISVYESCGLDPNNTTGSEIEQCVEDDFAARGTPIVVAGSTSATGQINVTQQPGPCGQLFTSETFNHEWSHETHRRELVEQFGQGSPAFNRAFNEPTDWANDEVRSRVVSNNYLLFLISRLDQICTQP